MSTAPDPVAAARGGDEVAFASLVEPVRRELLAHCYRMLGSLQDAEDAVQETLLRAWRGIQRFEARSSLRSWLYRIATNVCLSTLERRPARTLPLDVGPASDPVEPMRSTMDDTPWIEPFPDDPFERVETREGVELAFVAALQRLPPNERGALILRDVLGFSARETAEVFATSSAAVNSALQRARASLEDSRPQRTQQQTLRELGDTRQRQLVERYSRAMAEGNVDGVLALLSEDATWAMPPIPDWYAGHEAIAGFLAAAPFTRRWRHRPARANGQLAVGAYLWDADQRVFRAYALDVLELRGDRIAAITSFLSGVDFSRFGLPARLC
jgi:RNA polymerase sigma-70 factor (ECF subfamily)